jgi:hypothetical protein
MRLETESVNELPDENRFAKQSRVNHRAFITVLQQKTAAHEAAYGIELWRTISHISFMTGISPSPKFKINRLPSTKLDLQAAGRFFGAHLSCLERAGA